MLSNTVTMHKQEQGHSLEHDDHDLPNTGPRYPDLSQTRIDHVTKSKRRWEQIDYK